jgi:hypothetical protein
MGIPDYQTIMFTLLEFARDENEHSLREAIEVLADKFGLTDEERKELLPSGRQPTFDNRVGWARTYMKKAGLLEAPRRSYFRITPRGFQVLKKNPPEINVSFLRQFPEFIEFRTLRKEPLPSLEEPVGKATPEESLETGSIVMSTSNHLKSVFVIMPFGNRNEYRDGNKESDHVFNEIIRPAVSRAIATLGPDITVVIDREVDKNQSGSITESILKSLVTADVVIADLTGNNANVFFELGVRFSLRRKVTILLAQSQTTVPFDIQDYRLVKYDPFMAEEARAALANFIVTGLKDKSSHDSLVFKTFPVLSVRIPNVLEAGGPSVHSGAYALCKVKGRRPVQLVAACDKHILMKTPMSRTLLEALKPLGVLNTADRVRLDVAMVN